MQYITIDLRVLQTNLERRQVALGITYATTKEKWVDMIIVEKSKKKLVEGIDEVNW